MSRWADSSAGRAPRLQRGGLGFESPSVHKRLNSLSRDGDENGGAMFCELVGEQNREPVASQRRWKPTRGEAESPSVHK
jgi:hypothetical protein